MRKVSRPGLSRPLSDDVLTRALLNLASVHHSKNITKITVQTQSGTMWSYEISEDKCENCGRPYES